MRLERIVLDGFKSFANKTDFVFDATVTAIVGPNGCGKSNVVDAVKWVLGEQSAKSLRGGQMADVIFGGSSSRKSMGTAEVSLVISNANGEGTRQLPIDADEVQVSRRIYRSGESEYRINGKVCRLKDVRELFMDTGVGARAYSIMEQGQIEQLVSPSKTDRRVIFEEAAGISKYKAHKKEALRKLERTEQNLLRLADILGEVGKQLRSVKYQAGKARNYLRYSERLKELQVNYSLAEFDKISTLTAEKKNALEQVQERLARLAAEVAREDSSLSELGQRIIETEHKLNETGNRLVTVQGKIEQQLQRIEFLREKMAELRQRKQNASERTERLEEQKTRFAEDSAQQESELLNCEKVFEEKSQAAERIQERTKEISAGCRSLEANLEDEKSGVIDIVRRTAQLHNEIQSISVFRGNLSNQKDRLAGQADSAKAELEKQLAEKAKHNARLGDVENVLGELTEKLEAKRKEAEESDQALVAESKRLAEKKEQRSALNSELTVLTDMEEKREGLNKTIKDILQSRTDGEGRFDYVEGLLADLVAADFEYANAVEAALEGKTDAVVISDTGRLLADGQTIEQLGGRVKFVGMDRIEPFVDKKDLSRWAGVRGRLVEFVRCDGKYAPLAWKLLGKTIIVDSVEAGVELAGKLGQEYEFVTAKGEVVGTDGSVRLGPLGKPVGLISRKSRIRQLQKAIGDTASEITGLEEKIEKNTQKKTHLSGLCKDLRTAIYEANTEKTEVNSKLASIEQNIKRLQEEEPLIAGEMEMLEEQIARSVQKEYDSKQKLEELEAVNEQRTARIKELERRHAEQRGLLEAQSSELTELRVGLGQIIEQRKALLQTIASLERQTQENRTSTEAAQQEIRSCSEQLEQASKNILNCEAAVSELYVEKEKSQESNSLLQEEVEKLLKEQKEKEELVRQKRAEQSQVESGIGELKIELGQLEVKSQDLVERIQEELQIDLAEAYEGYRDSEVDWARVREEIMELREKIERLGNVNLDAIDEQEELEKRHDFLSSQVEDLNKSKADLQQLINRLNRMSREKFRETFEEIRVHFQQIFRKLFGGGRADIVLEDAEDILEAGIEVIARPPGKETRSISLLSGGEKSMTAIALLFAVFQTKPSPFCFLDEIDAALDEANNERFNLLVQEFQKGSQFVIITHAKRTMSIADRLVGITMQTQGVSKKICVNFDQYDEVEEHAAAVA